MKLFCFTYAGGTAGFFDLIEKSAGDALDFIKLEYAGHGQRHKESLYSDFEQLIEDLFPKVRLEINNGEPYALFGYSMGCITAVEILRKILKFEDLNSPVHVFLAAHEPRTKNELVGYSDDELDEYVKRRTICFGGVPEKLIHNKSFWRVYLPIYRGDYSIIGKYKFEYLNLKTEIPATVFYSETDTPYEEMKQWENYFCRDCKFIEYTGPHFFMNEHYEKMASDIKKRLGVWI